MPRAHAPVFVPIVFKISHLFRYCLAYFRAIAVLPSVEPSSTSNNSQSDKSERTHSQSASSIKFWALRKMVITDTSGLLTIFFTFKGSS